MNSIKKKITVCLPEDLQVKIKALAAQEYRSVNKQIEHILKIALENHSHSEN